MTEPKKQLYISLHLNSMALFDIKDAPVLQSLGKDRAGNDIHQRHDGKSSGACIMQSVWNIENTTKEEFLAEIARKAEDWWNTLEHSRNTSDGGRQ